MKVEVKKSSGREVTMVTWEAEERGHGDMRVEVKFESLHLVQAH